ncbi:hypothetical protein IFM89_006393 [Coptis chinensis]|uniref:Uncharacterized protein n=1 Tax=Coptis chinensis TaxID=261450 RepID=A0A835HTI3_9MAGN|nr:hypothetical protein IFM89_006393 [Coptis chinensis]
MEKEPLVPLEGSRPTVTVLGKSSPDRKDPRGRNSNKRTPKSNKSRPKQVETEVRTASPKTEIKDHASIEHGLELPKRVDSAKPLKPEAKCNCTVM